MEESVRVIQVCPSTLKEISCFNSMTTASLFTGIHRTSIGKGASGKRKLAGGYIWKYA